jgi:hypothetical protein
LATEKGQLAPKQASISASAYGAISTGTTTPDLLSALALLASGARGF